MLYQESKGKTTAFSPASAEISVRFKLFNLSVKGLIIGRQRPGKKPSKETRTT